MDLKTLTDDQLVAAFLRIRDLRDTAKRIFTEKQKPLVNGLTNIEAEFLRRMNEAGQQSVKTVDGTAYKKERNSVSVNDKSLFMDFISKNDAWDLLDVKANVTASVSFMEEHEAAPPGVKVNRDIVVNVRTNPNR